MDQIFLGNRYELHEEIGSGGMAHVFKARDTLLDRIVAIKILKPEYTEDAQFIERFRVEAKAAASLSNANIVMIYDVGQDDGVYYIIMEYVDGVTLKSYIASIGQIPWKEAVTLAVQMTQAIDSAHQNNIIHRDIKPQNVLITRDRKIKITDFGIARAASSTTITTVGNAMGSVHYFSPEQAKGALTDEKSDIYSLGITLYEMVTGVVPFEGETPIAVALKHIQEPPADPSQHNPQIPRGLSAVILKAIAKDKFDRYMSMGEMLSDLKKVMKDPSGETLQFASVYSGGQAWGNGFSAAGGYPNNGGYPGAGAYANGGGYPRENDYRDARRQGGGYGAGAAGGAYDDRGKYNDRNIYAGRNGYVQDGYAPGGDVDYAADGDFTIQGDDYAEDGFEGGYDGGDVYAADGYAVDAAEPEGDMSGGGRRSGGTRGKPAGNVYRAGARSASNNQRNLRGGVYERNQRRDSKKSGRRDDGGGSRGGYTGVFVIVVLIAVAAAIGFVVWIMNNLMNVIQPPSGTNNDDENFSVASYIDRRYDDVYEELREAGIQCQDVRIPSDSKEEGLIISQSIERGRILKRNGPETIVFEVSSGARRFTVPDYREYGSDSRAAEAELKANSLDVTVVDEPNSVVPKGYVVRTEPGAGSQLAAGSQITIFRSIGSEAGQTIVPYLMDKTYREALELIDEAGLTLGVVTPETTLTSAIVIWQSLSPNTVVDEGMTIDLRFEEAGLEASPEDTPEPTPEATPEETPELTPDPTPGETPETAEPTPTPDQNETTTSENSEATGQTTESQGQTIISGEPVSMSISLRLPPDIEYEDIVKVLVEATPSDTGRTTRLLNRSVRKDDFPRNIDFTIPANGSVEIKVYYDGVLMQTKVFDANE